MALLKLFVVCGFLFFCPFKKIECEVVLELNHPNMSNTTNGTAITANHLSSDEGAPDHLPFDEGTSVAPDYEPPDNSFEDCAKHILAYLPSHREVGSFLAQHNITISKCTRVVVAVAFAVAIWRAPPRAANPRGLLHLPPF